MAGAQCALSAPTLRGAAFCREHGRRASDNKRAQMNSHHHHQQQQQHEHHQLDTNHQPKRNKQLHRPPPPPPLQSTGLANEKRGKRTFARVAALLLPLSPTTAAA